jgi:hypothetical protein
MVLLLTGRVATLPHENGLPNTDWADAVRCFDALTSLAERRPEWPDLTWWRATGR